MVRVPRKGRTCSRDAAGAPPRQSDDQGVLPTQIAYWSHSKKKSKRMRIASNYIIMNTTTDRQRDTTQKLTTREIRSHQARPINIQVNTPQKIDPLYNYANVIQATLNTISKTNHPQKRE
jgi:hypothetical protein